MLHRHSLETLISEKLFSYSFCVSHFVDIYRVIHQEENAVIVLPVTILPGTKDLNSQDFS